MFFLVLFIYYPAVKTLFKSLFLINSSNIPVKFVGLGNYRKLFSDETFLKSINIRVCTGCHTGDDSNGVSPVADLRVRETPLSRL